MTQIVFAMLYLFHRIINPIPLKKQLKILVSLEEASSGKPQAKPGGQAVLWLAASKRLNVNRMHMPTFTFDLFEAAFHVPRRPQASPGVSHILTLRGWLASIQDMIAGQNAFTSRVTWRIVACH